MSSLEVEFDRTSSIDQIEIEVENEHGEVIESMSAFDNIANKPGVVDRPTFLKESIITPLQNLGADLHPNSKQQKMRRRSSFFLGGKAGNFGFAV